ncbi:Crp/Fnr family transcriptional regulator [Pontibacter sp. G13]|uniref:Crp/Fnr family transcriptional regulator n=1 Tax=Pontibacter sp. G13 TaxID=3074898 RepID=UPI00288BD7C6|nr:Crp/Fnr family transcriptional regulator [Pontibacter sp. G13]WNJ17031.1 Crp/Fnr family transcriptional regulator [Pontibacter sp. G13]
MAYSFSDSIQQAFAGLVSDQQLSLSSEEWAALTAVVYPLNLEKGAYFLEAGDISNRMAFLFSGLLRVFERVEDREFTSYFNVFPRNPIVCGYTSFITQRAATESIQALEPCQLVAISHPDLHKLYRQFPIFQQLGRILMEQNYVASMKRIHSLQHASAKDRYLQLLTKYPDLMNRIPHHYIASYLGITPESLSRIRRQLKHSLP